MLEKKNKDMALGTQSYEKSHNILKEIKNLLVFTNVFFPRTTTNTFITHNLKKTSIIQEMWDNKFFFKYYDRNSYQVSTIVADNNKITSLAETDMIHCENRWVWENAKKENTPINYKFVTFWVCTDVPIFFIISICLELYLWKKSSYI